MQNRPPGDGTTAQREAVTMTILARRALATLAGVFLGAHALAQSPGETAANPLPPFVASGLEQSIRAQVLDPGRTRFRVIVHFAGGAGENGRICGEVIEPAGAGERVRTFVSTYTRAGRVLTRFEDGPFPEFLARDTVFRNCSPRL